MKKREFLKKSSLLTVGVMTVPMIGCNNPSSKETETTESSSDVFTPFELPELQYETNALEPYIDGRTMGIHHGKHHAGYVRKLNAALEGHSLAGKDLLEIVQSVTDEDTGVRNNGGGHFNHSLFWEVMKPGGGEMPAGKLSDAVNAAFDSFDKFKETFSKAAATRFGSGWAWMSVGDDGKLFVSSTPNQDNPLMTNLVEENGKPILGIDVWEHAYYLNYQNRRGDYISNFFNIINWEKVAQNFDKVS